MNQDQYEKARDALSTGCIISGLYLCSGMTCAIGALAKLAEVPDEELLKASSQHIGDCETVGKAVERKFGLTIEEQGQIQNANDAVVDKIGVDKERFRERTDDVLLVLDRIARRRKLRVHGTPPATLVRQIPSL